MRPLLAAVLAAMAVPAVAVAADPGARRLEHALVHHRGGDPKPTAADCRRATPAERARDPFGNARRVFTCRITLHGQRATYDVQVLGNGCFVAERRRRGQAIYGCGA